MQGGAQSEFSIGALVRTQPPILPTVGDMGPWSSRPSCRSGLWAEAAQMKLSPRTDGRLFQARPWADQQEVSLLGTLSPWTRQVVLSHFKSSLA
jgi:hypothetical protein